MMNKHSASHTTRGTLAVVGTPIGNLDDVSSRARDALARADLVVCEDTRITKRLLERYCIDRPMTSVHQHSSEGRIKEIADELRKGKTVALVTDAGTPGVSDPGGMLVAAAYDAGARIIAVPGPSAVTAALSVSGLPTDRFRFFGFIPHKKGRETMLKEIADMSETAIFFESPHRLMKTLQRLKELMSNDRIVVVARELTKMFEEVVRGSVSYVCDVFTDNPGKVRGEFVVIIGAK
ncbi:MAG: 16S rRNA (cytidine(1402)-2'-O)-methyltransferase [Candidatus Kerfeldbacteria bacterium]